MMFIKGAILAMVGSAAVLPHNSGIVARAVEGVCQAGTKMFWKINKYSEEWSPTSFGDVVQDEQDHARFVFENGITHYLDDGSMRASWEGAVWYRAYYEAGFQQFPYMNFSNPILTMNPNGSGEVTFDVYWYSEDYGSNNTARRVPVLDWNSAEIKYDGDFVEYTFNPAEKFYGRVYVPEPGYFKYSQFNDSYPIPFVEWLDNGIKAWWFTTTASLDKNKPPLPFTVRVPNDNNVPCPEPPAPSSSLAPAPTSSPVEPTSSPVEPTSSPVEPTSSPVEPTSSPVEPTSSPVEPTSSPVEPTSSPVDPSSSVVSTDISPPEPSTAVGPSSTGSVAPTGTSHSDPSSVVSGSVITTTSSVLRTITSCDTETCHTFTKSEAPKPVTVTETDVHTITSCDTETCHTFTKTDAPKPTTVTKTDVHTITSCDTETCVLYTSTKTGTQVAPSHTSKDEHKSKDDHKSKSETVTESVITSVIDSKTVVITQRITLTKTICESDCSTHLVPTGATTSGPAPAPVPTGTGVVPHNAGSKAALSVAFAFGAALLAFL